MFVETTYPSREITFQINKKVGKPYSLMERLKMGGIGSKRMSIEEVSPEYNEYLNPDYYVTHGNIELRPKGIIIHFRYKLESYTLVIAFDELKVETDNKLILRFGESFIKFKNGLEVNGKFITRLTRMLPQS